MGHGHSHLGEEPRVEIGSRARIALTSFLVLIGVLAAAGLIWLWPASSQVEAATNYQSDAPDVTYEQARIAEIVEGCEFTVADNLPCQTAFVDVLTGEDAGTEQMIELVGPTAQAGLQEGDEVEVARIPTFEGPLYAYSGTDRSSVLITMAVLFVVVVVAVARWRGLFAIVGLGFAAFVLMGFMLPALIVGKPGMAVALVGSTAIMFVVLYVAHGVTYRSSTALAGTFIGLYFTTALGAFAVRAARLSGFADENDYDLGQLVPGLNFQELLMVAIIVGGLGVLNDVTITQSSAVFELRAAAPRMGRLQLWRHGMRIGRDHIASTIYTIVFAYAGGALAILLLLYFTTRDGAALLGVEMFASEIVRTLASAIGLVVSVPITTAIAALTVGPAQEDVAVQAHDTYPAGS